MCFLFLSHTLIIHPSHWPIEEFLLPLVLTLSSAFSSAFSALSFLFCLIYFRIPNSLGLFCLRFSSIFFSLGYLSSPCTIWETVSWFMCPCCFLLKDLLGIQFADLSSS